MKSTAARLQNLLTHNRFHYRVSIADQLNVRGGGKMNMIDGNKETHRQLTKINNNIHHNSNTI